MARGKAAAVGNEMVSANGYRYVKTKDGWRLKHHVIAEKELGRKIRKAEMVRFADGNKENFSPDNIKVVVKGNGSLYRRKAALESRIEDLKGELAQVNNEIKILENSKLE